jgi:hypothetical protein
VGRAISGLDRGVQYSTATPTRFKRAELLVRLSGRKRRNAIITGTTPEIPTKRSRKVQYSVEPKDIQLYAEAFRIAGMPE